MYARNNQLCFVCFRYCAVGANRCTSSVYNPHITGERFLNGFGALDVYLDHHQPHGHTLELVRAKLRYRLLYYLINQ